MQSSQFATLAEVIQQYNHAAPGTVGRNELKPLHLSTTEMVQLEAFLLALRGRPMCCQHYCNLDATLL
jgi:hypothetical protein